MNKTSRSADANKALTPALLLSLLAPTLIGLYLLTTSTSQLFPDIWIYDAKRLLQFILFFSLFLLPLFSPELRGELGGQLAAVPGWIKWTAAAILVWGITSALYNGQSPMHTANSLSEVALYYLLVSAVFVIAACRRIAGGWFDGIAIGFVALTGLAVGVQELVGVLAAHAGGVEFNYRISMIYFSWPRFYNQVQSWIIPALLALPVIYSRYRLAYPACLLVLGLQWYIIFMTGARGAFLSITAAVLLAIVFLPAIRKSLLGGQAAGLLLGAVIYAAVLVSFEATTPDSATVANEAPSGQQTHRPVTRGFYGNEKETGSSFLAQSLGRPMANTSGRTRMWKSAAQDAISNPLLGIGPMNYVCTSPVPMSHPHNFVLQTAAEWGIFVAVAVSLVFLYLLLASFQWLRRQDSDASKKYKSASFLLTGILAAAFYCCLSGVLVMPASQVSGVLVCGMLMGMIAPGPSNNRPIPGARLFLPPLIFSIALLILGRHELSSMDARAELLRPGYDLQPRIWQEGKICTFYTEQKPVNN